MNSAARPRLQKLMLSGNALDRLPRVWPGIGTLELVRFASNRFERLPPWLAEMPALAWMSYSGNAAEPASPPAQAPLVPWADLTVGPLLGEGSSGWVHRATWRGEVALKLFKGAMGSDGLPEREIAACLAAGDHPAVIGAWAASRPPGGHAGPAAAPRPAEWPVLAGPRASRVAAATSTIRRSGSARTPCGASRAASPRPWRICTGGG